MDQCPNPTSSTNNIFEHVSQLVDDFNKKLISREVQPTVQVLETFLTTIEPLMSVLILEQEHHGPFRGDLALLRITNIQDGLPGRITYPELHDRSPSLAEVYKDQLALFDEERRKNNNDDEVMASEDQKSYQPTFNNQQTSTNPFSLDLNTFTSFNQWLQDAIDNQYSNMYRKFDRGTVKSGFGTKVELKAGLAEGTGVIAQEDLGLNDVIVKIPRSAMITVTNLEQLPQYRPLLTLDPFFAQNFDESTTLAIMLALERYDPHSCYRHYINLLPNYVPCILTTTINDLFLLRKSPHYLSVLRTFLRCITSYFRIAQNIITFNAVVDSNLQLGQLKVKYKDQLSTLVTEMKLLRPPPNPKMGTTPIHGLSWVIFRWASSIVMSRQNPIPSLDEQSTVLALIPGFDFINMDITDDPEMRVVNTDYDIDSHTSLTYANKSIKAGEQFYMFYGHRSALQYALYQGFIPKSPHFGQIIGGYKYLDSTPLNITGSFERSGLSTIHINSIFAARLYMGIDLPSITIPFLPHLPELTPQFSSFEAYTSEERQFILKEISRREWMVTRAKQTNTFSTLKPFPSTITKATGKDGKFERTLRVPPLGVPLNIIEMTKENSKALKWTQIWKLFYLATLSTQDLDRLIERLFKLIKSGISQVSSPQNEIARAQSSIRTCPRGSPRLLQALSFVKNGTEREALSLALLLSPTLIPNTTQNMKIAIMEGMIPFFDQFLQSSQNELQEIPKLYQQSTHYLSPSRYTAAGQLFQQFYQIELNDIATQLDALKAFVKQL